jgi:hypothetical protein
VVIRTFCAAGDRFERPLTDFFSSIDARQDLPDLRPLYFGFSEMPLVSISDGQRAPSPNANFAATIYHGLPTDLHRPTFNPRGGYLAFPNRLRAGKEPVPRNAMCVRAMSAAQHRQCQQKTPQQHGRFP